MADSVSKTESTSLYHLDLCQEQIWLNTVTLISCAMIIASPFVAFYVNGRIDTQHWFSSLYLATIGFTWLAFEYLRFRRNVPQELREQRLRGKLYKPLMSLQGQSETLTYTTRKANKGEVVLNSEGVFISAAAHLRSSHQIKASAAQNHDNAGYILSVKWPNIKEWVVRGDTKGPGYFLLLYGDNQFTELRRPLASGRERAVFDYIRSVGQCPVRLFDDAH